MFGVHAWLPAEASFGFVNEMRARSSGGASVSLLLSHWERLQVCSMSSCRHASSVPRRCHGGHFAMPRQGSSALAESCRQLQ